MKELSWKVTVYCSLFVLLTIIIIVVFLWNTVEPLKIDIANNTIVTALSLLAAILSILTGACIAALFAFKYADATYKERGPCFLIAWLFISAIFIFIFLAIYCLFKVGAIESMNLFAQILLFSGTFGLLNGVVLLERWDATTLPIAKPHPISEPHNNDTK